MKKLLLISLVAFSYNAKGQDGIRDTSIKINDIDTLKIDQNLLSFEEKQYLKTVDSISSIIDSKSLCSQTIINERGQITGYSETQKGIVNKITASGKTSQHDVVYVFYYVDGKVVKVESFEKVYPPFCSKIYFLDDKVLKPNELSFRSAQAVKILSAQYSILFKRW